MTGEHPPRILISACLLGQPVRYNGRGSLCDHPVIHKWRAAGQIVPLCPEVAAGFSTPRPSAEIETGFTGRDVIEGRARIFEDTGHDVTAQMLAGAKLAVERALKENCAFALLKEGSPSCGSRLIYSGRFDGDTRTGHGVVAAALRSNNIQVFSEHQIDELVALFDL